MQSALKVKTRVLPGKRVEVTAPELVEGEDVELIILKPETSTEQPRQFASAWDFLQSCTAAQRSTPAEDCPALSSNCQADQAQRPSGAGLAHTPRAFEKAIAQLSPRRGDPSEAPQYLTGDTCPAWREPDARRSCCAPQRRPLRLD